MSLPTPPLVVMGVSGCGKSTVGALLGERLGVPFLDGDDFHPAANKAKMAAGIPLTDGDRTPWLDRIGQVLAGNHDGGTTVPPIVACSALKRSYRDQLRSHAPEVVFVHLTGDPATIAARLDARAHEFMPGSLLDSQLATLETPGPDEAHVTGDIALPPAGMVEGIVGQLEHLRANAGAA